MEMANREKGEVSFDAGGTTYTMALTIDAMVAVEELFSTPTKMVTFDQITELVDSGSAKHLRGMLWAVMQLHQPEFTVSDVSPMVQAMGGLQVMRAQLIRLAKASQADPKDLEALGVGKGANPQKAQTSKKEVNGTGAASSSGHAGTV